MIRKLAEWPDYPRCLSEAFLGKDCNGQADDPSIVGLKIPKLLIVGASQFLELEYDEKVPITIYEYRAGDKSDAKSILREGNCVEFCESVNDSNRIGDNKKVDNLTKECSDDNKEIDNLKKECIKDYKERAALYLSSDANEIREGCIIGLQSIFCGIRVSERLVGVCVAGRFIKKGDKGKVKENLLNYCKKLNIMEDEEARYVKYVESLPEYGEPIINELRGKIQDIAKLVETIAESSYRACLAAKETEFLRKIGKMIFENPIPDNYIGFRDRIRNVLEEIRKFCRFSYIVFFGSININDNVLGVVAQSGFDVDNLEVHFNWKKANLGDDFEPNGKLEFEPEFIEKMKRGIRGEDRHKLENFLYTIPFRYTNGYKGAMVLGPTKSQVNAGLEHSFFHRLCHNTGLRILGQSVLLSLNAREKHEHERAIMLGHTTKSSLNAVYQEILYVDKYLKKTINGYDSNDIKVSIDRISEDMKTTSEYAKRILRRNVNIPSIYGGKFQINKNECQFANYSLAVLIMNCVDMYEAEAKAKNIVIDIEDVDKLPTIKLDKTLMDIAISNLIDNAIKYSASGKTIYIRGECKTGRVVLEFDDYGLGISDEEKEKIFNIEYRSIYKNRIRKVEGYGLGLPLAKSIVEVHNGDIWCTSKRQDTGKSTPGAGYRTIFYMSLPLDKIVNGDITAYVET
ncbi:MAG: HAMP domain-containing histidine kinase [Nitrospirae bacterium]|nr:HAMP domain-containing histidine kinase [Nitrospirota bacterium]